MVEATDLARAPGDLGFPAVQPPAGDCSNAVNDTSPSSGSGLNVGSFSACAAMLASLQQKQARAHAARYLLDLELGAAAIEQPRDEWRCWYCSYSAFNARQQVIFLPGARGETAGCHGAHEQR